MSLLSLVVISHAIPLPLSSVVFAEGLFSHVCNVTDPARQGLTSVLFFLRKSSFVQGRSLMDVWPVDYLGRFLPRFQMNYMLLSTLFTERFISRTSIDENRPLPSAINLFPAAGWLERESWDMFGVFFEGNPDLRRILTDYGFTGYPLRKDFPLTGFLEVRFDDENKSVVHEEVVLTQEYRLFDYTSPWEKK